MTRTVMVTAVGGGGVGEQLIKALRLAPKPYRIVGTDMTLSLGFGDVDIPVLVPRESGESYLATILDVSRRFGVRAIFPGSEPELAVLSSARGELAAAGVADPEESRVVCYQVEALRERLAAPEIPLSTGVAQWAETRRAELAKEAAP